MILINLIFINILVYINFFYFFILILFNLI